MSHLIRFSRVLRSLGLIVATCILVACGGGGGGSTPPAVAVPVPIADVADKYVGTWEGCDGNATAGTSSFETYRFTKTAADKLSAVVATKNYLNSTCTVPVNSTLDVTTTLTIAGTQTVATAGGPVTADKAIAVSSNVAGVEIKQIYYVDGPTMRVGSFAPKDTDGYPTTLAPFSLIKKP